MLCDAFAAVLKAERVKFNTLFEQARRSYPALDSAAFYDFLVHCADPWVRAVHAAKPECVWDTVHAAYELGLELVGRQLAGPHARADGINHTWQRVLCSAAGVVADEPLRLARALSNAAHQLSIAVGTQSDVWIERMSAFAPHAPDADALLRLGQVLAWQSGMAQYRNSALGAADLLPPALALMAVSADVSADWSTEREQLRSNPWYRPRSRSVAAGLVARTGRFRGFGGLFPQPPCVVAQGVSLYARSGESYWQLIADAFGATFHRSTDAGMIKAFSPLRKLPKGLMLPASLGAPTSVAATQTTIAVTGKYTHEVLLFSQQPIQP